MATIRAILPSLHRQTSALGLCRRWYSNAANDADSSKWSYVSCPGKEPLLGLTLGQVMDRAVTNFGDREAIVSVQQNIRKTFTEVNEECEGVAAGLLATGLRPGERIGVWGANTYEWYITQFAAAKAGLILVNINPAYRPNELEYCLNKVEVKAIVCDEKFKTSDYYSMLVELAPELSDSPFGQLKSARLPHLSHVFMSSEHTPSGTMRFRDVSEAGDSGHRRTVSELESKLQFDAPCNIQFTSGTTGLPKGAVLSHHMLVNNAYSIGSRTQYQDKVHRICISVPLYHCFGCVAGTISGALFGAASVLPSAGFDPAAIVRALEEERITSCYGTPTMFVDILAAHRRNPTSLEHLSTGIMAGAPCPQELVNAVMNDLHMKDFLVMYGMTETSPVSFQCFPHDPPHVRATTIGYPGDHIEVKVVDDEGKIVPRGVAGELLVRGYCNFLGYWDDEAKTQEIMAEDRWLNTGDLAVLESNGYGRIIGRIKDLVIRGGENIYPAEVENYLMAHPDVLEAQVFGVDDPRMGEELAAWLRMADGTSLSQEDVRAWCKGKMAHYKIPRYVLFKDEFPRTVTGKIQKFKMREATTKELGL